MKINEIYLGDCLELMPKYVEDKSIDMIFCDLPYGTTGCKWDSVINFELMWEQLNRIIKNNKNFLARTIYLSRIFICVGAVRIVKLCIHRGTTMCFERN